MSMKQAIIVLLFLLSTNCYASNDCSIYAYLQNFSENIATIQTKRYIIRIDEMQNGDLRYVSWKNKTITDEPDLILYDGVYEHEGSWPNVSYTFRKDDYTYKIYRNGVQDEFDNPYKYNLIIYRGTHRIMNYGGNDYKCN
ncbi:MAG: hypothetical protein LBL75_02550 [Rickettsiales bacterium]|nr:hypothetical protein [Rickettsiales bacterium]